LKGDAIGNLYSYVAQNSDHMKQIAAESAVAEVKDGMVVGLGTGSTAAFATQALGKRVREGLDIVGIPTSKQTEAQAKALGIRLSSIDEQVEIDLTIDGADEVEKGPLNLIKGYGGALLREKIVASATKRLIIIADQSKLVEKLGTNHSVPVEVVPFGWKLAAQKIQNLGSKPELRANPDGSPFVTDGGHYFLNCKFGPIEDPASLADELDRIVGVVEHGLFIGMAAEVRLGGPAGVETLLAEKM
jgi:ribose 5-phosphate isomerase A